MILYTESNIGVERWRHIAHIHVYDDGIFVDSENTTDDQHLWALRVRRPGRELDPTKYKVIHLKTDTNEIIRVLKAMRVEIVPKKPGGYVYSSQTDPYQEDDS